MADRERAQLGRGQGVITNQNLVQPSPLAYSSSTVSPLGNMSFNTARIFT
jgi:hypothetical protein